MTRKWDGLPAAEKYRLGVLGDGVLAILGKSVQKGGSDELGKRVVVAMAGSSKLGPDTARSWRFWLPKTDRRRN